MITKYVCLSCLAELSPSAQMYSSVKHRVCNFLTMHRSHERPPTVSLAVESPDAQTMHFEEPTHPTWFHCELCNRYGWTFPYQGTSK
jgi:hypothetical protein